ncbi:hypothetical protein FNH22_18805 [Fulvivirga sp. M361]|uniref:helix-turn-helix and ligand-binding sensor domain-containing protein n=1 Tax=Fulvivirga sp. M361 TaxID=2594266 RepID=UPI00117BDBC8|nr:triple tyrosine motif-containing protein [Fulvivirga sp. M361]TRX54805.1 hypothetical protein FNH22_18805 [Fulvivirga sp. M361]
MTNFYCYRNYSLPLTFFLFYLTFSLLCVHRSHAFLGKYPIHNFTPTHYKAGIQNIDFAQNRDMTLFVANNLGILSFNGTQWETHALKTGKKQRSLAFDENTNRLYVGSQGEFGYFEEDWDYVSLVDKVPSVSRDFDEVWDVFFFNSNVYFCTFQGIYAYDGQSVSVIERSGGFNRSFSTSDKLFTQSPSGELFEIKGKELVPTFPKGLTDQIIAGIIPQGEGYLLFYNSGQIEFSTSFGVVEKYSDLIQALQGKYVNHVMQLSDTRLVISTQTSGLFLYDLQQQRIENITTEGGLQSSACLNTFQDYAGNLWVGMQNGMALIDINSPMRLINKEINIQGSGYEAFETDEGTYYTTSNGIYFLAKNATRCVFLKGTEGPAYGMQKITGKLYAGHHTGLFHIENGKATHIATTEGLWHLKQLRAKPDFAIGGTYSGLYLFKINERKELQPVQKIKGFNESSRFFQEDHEGRIWVGQFYKGLYQLSLNEDLTAATVTKVSDLYDLPIKERIILSNVDNEIHIATETGVYKFDETKDRILEAEVFSDIIGKEQVHFLVQGNQKHIHIFTENLVGFFKQISANNYIYVPSSLFQLRYSFNNDLLNVSVNTSNGVLFNANEGFIHYNPELEDRVTVEKEPVISKVYSVTEDRALYVRLPFEKRRVSTEQVLITHKAKVLQFEVESFKFKGASDQQFRYFLKGFDKNYGEWTNTTTKEYTNMREGEYELLVQTLNYLGETVTSTPLLLKVTPPFYRSLVAKILYVALATLMLTLAYRFQKQRLRRKEEKMNEAKQAELREKQNEVQELKDAKIKSELRHVNNLLAASTMNLVVKNEFLEAVKEELKQVKQKGKIVETKQALEQIVKEIDSTLRLQEDWQQFEHHFDKVHGDFLNRLRDEFHDLSPSEQKLCAFLRLNLNTKEIANLMGISSRGVEVARYRLRKKLNLTTSQNLSKFVLDY